MSTELVVSRASNIADLNKALSVLNRGYRLCPSVKSTHPAAQASITSYINMIQTAFVSNALFAFPRKTVY